MSYKNFVFGSSTAFDVEDDGVYQLVDSDGDGSPDLVYIKTRNTANNYAEVHITSYESLFQKAPIKFESAINCDNNGTWLMRDLTGNQKADLVYIKNQNTSSGKIEICVASQSDDDASNFKTCTWTQTYWLCCGGPNDVFTLTDKGDLIYGKSSSSTKLVPV